MKQKALYTTLALAAAALTASAQETYLNADIATTDLNGTARYVGMGGAMDALGADLSTISSNPAGIGLFRSSQAKVSFGMVAQEGGKSFANSDKTNLSFDQAGFVYSMRTGKQSFVNFAFNFTKSRNFDYILSASSSLNGASQNKQTYLKYNLGMFDLTNEDGVYNSGSWCFSAADYLYANTTLLGPSADGTTIAPNSYFDASGYSFNRGNSGYIGQYDFNVSGNVNDRFYWGLTIGIHDVHYHGYSEYREALVYNNARLSDLVMTDDRRITGTGYDLKVGFIFRPIEESPFRVGLSVATPTWYDLKSSYYDRISTGIDYSQLVADYGGYNDEGHDAQTYEFRLNTPWRFGLSLGTTIGDYLAIGAGYEYADYSNLDTRVKDGGYYDYYYDDYYESSSSDDAMNRATEETLKGVSTVKVGLEYKPMKPLAIRLGYNYVSPMYKTDAYKGVDVDAYSNKFTSTTDYTNWECTHRITAGLGYAIDKFSIDLAYQYQTQNGKFYPFCNGDMDNGQVTNYVDAQNVSNKRHQLLLTLGYRF